MSRSRQTGPAAALVLLVVVTLATSLFAQGRGAAPPEDPNPPERALGFDHLFHDSRLNVKGLESLPCRRCHLPTAKGDVPAPGHGACFAAGCHDEPAADAGDEARALCLACHDRRRPARGAGFVSAGSASRDYGVRFPHDRHGEASCERCHAVPSSDAAPAPVGARAGKAPRTQAAPGKTRGPAPPAPRAPHARCLDCHGPTEKSSSFPLATCERCHDALGGRFEAPALSPGVYSVGGRFNHTTHLARPAGPAKPSGAGRCGPCHDNLLGTSTRQIPSPPMTACESCHDGQTAFAALEPTCTRCHVRGAASAPGGEPRRYQHGTHEALGVGDCATCHGLGPDGRPRPAAADHRPCADARCHAAEFRAAAPTICSGCHVGTEPWRHLAADVPRRRQTEFGVDFDHRSHLGGERPRIGFACARCHSGIRAGPAMRLGGGHDACAGSTCHGPPGAASAAAPSLDRCRACHVGELLPARDRRRARSRWAVAARFDHDRHASADAGPAGACEACHLGVTTASHVVEIQPPPKARCAPCHDGARAFKMTGPACARCHGGT